jgi:hypothetical protein
MRRLIIHLTVWAFTFSGGVTLQLMITAGSRVPETSHTLEIKPASPEPGEPSGQSGVTSPTALTSDSAPGPFDPSGDYHPANLPRPSSEKFTYFDLEVGRRKGKLVAWGDVRGGGRQYKFASVSVTEQTLKFTTVSIRGVRYSFEGKFLGRGDFPSQATLGHGIVMLEGTLTRFEHGEKAAEITSPFVYYSGC